MTEENKGVAKSATVMMIAMLVSRVLGFVRDIIIYDTFGQNRFTDAYQAAFKIPDFIYMILVGGAFSAAFVPAFASYLAQKKEKEAWDMASVTLNIVCVAMVFLLTLGFIFTNQLVELLVPGFDEQSMRLTVTLTRIMFFQVIFMALAGICSGILQAYKIFTPTAIGSVFYNLGIIVVGAIFSGIIEKHIPGYGIAAFSLGVVAGACGNFLIQAGALRKVGLRYSFSFDIHNEGFRTIISLMIPVLIGLSASELGLFVNQRLASHLDDGLLSALNSAQRFMQLPISIFGISIAMTLFPVLTREAATDRIEDFRQDYSSGLKSIFFICIPCSFLLAVLGVSLIRLMYQGSSFTPENTAATAYALVFFSIGIFAQGGIHLSSRAFYAFKDTKTPVIMAIIGVAVNILFSYLLVKPLAQGGLALAYSISGIVNLFLLMYMLKRKIGRFYGKDILRTMLLTIFASALMSVVVYKVADFCENVFGVASKATQAIQLFSAGIIGVVVFLLVAKFLKMPEVEGAVDIVKRKLHLKSKKS